jgi:hypothetical protein
MNGITQYKSCHADAMNQSHRTKAIPSDIQYQTNLNDKRLHHENTKDDHQRSITSSELSQQRKI